MTFDKILEKKFDGKRLTSFFRGQSILDRNKMNGADERMTFEEVFQKYRTLYLPTLSRASSLKKVYRCSKYLFELFPVRMCLLNPETIGDYISYKKDNYKPQGTSTRYNFEKEIKDLSSILNWWRDTFDFKFQNPVKKFHFTLGVINETPEKNKKMSPPQVKRFFDYLPPFYKEIAMIQFYMAGRIGETAGILKRNIDLDKRILRVREILIWTGGRPEIKKLPKNGHERQVYINDAMLEIIEQKLREDKSANPFLFHENCEPLLYNRIRVNYRKALIEAGLSQFSGTHLMRHAMATTTRQVTGSIDSVQAVTGHISVRMAEHYGALSANPLNKDSLEKVGAFMDSI